MDLKGVKMEKYILILIVVSFSFLSIVNAEKPKWAGKGKDAKEEMKSQKGKAPKGKDDYKKEKKNEKVKKGETPKGLEKQKEKKKEEVKKGETPKGLEKQKEKKSLQEQK